MSLLHQPPAHPGPRRRPPRGERRGLGGLEAVRRESAGMAPPVPGSPAGVARVVGTAILGTSYVVAGIGLLCLVASPWAVLPAPFGLLLIGAAAYPRPLRPPRPEGSLGRGEAPALFGHLDRVAAELGVGRIDGVVVDARFQRLRRKRGSRSTGSGSGRRCG